MIRCLVSLDAAGCLVGFEASGHALSGVPGLPDGRGFDPACAGVSALLRTAARLLYRHPGLQVGGGADRPGRMLLELSSASEGTRAWLQGVTDFLLAGLQDIQDEYPQSLKLEIRRKGTTNHGT
ncbi:MAG: ribosomal-processing cysteine protease Prp [Spirochaetales bacterium]|nr:ribosomal-processing cysteine protease Prp [Spirochaetales bacterium]